MNALIKKTALTGSVLAMAAIGTILPAVADDCSDMLSKVTEASAQVNLPAQQAQQVEAYRASALEKQNAGDTAGCVADLTAAADILGIS